MTTAQSSMIAEGQPGRYSALPMALNTSAAGTSIASNIVSVTITPTVANTIIVLLIGADLRTGSGPAVSPPITDTHGLTWHKRFARTFSVNASGVGFLGCEIWWAAAPVAQAYAITVEFVNSNNGSAVHAIAVAGVENAQAPWDLSTGLTGSAGLNNASVTAQATDTFSTLDANTFTFAYAISEGSVAWAVGTINGVTATEIQSSSMAGVVTDKMFSEYTVNTSALSVGTVANLTTNTFDWLFVIDALAG